MTKLKYTGANDAQVNWGNNTDPRPILIKGYAYELYNVEVHSCHSKVALKGIQGWFNSTSFEDADDAENNWLKPYLEKWITGESDDYAK